MMRPYSSVSRSPRTQFSAQAATLRVLAAGVLAALLGLALFAADVAHAQVLASPVVARFDGGIGSQPLRAGGAPNLALGVSPGGAPWVIDRLTATATTTRIRVDGRGLLLGGGDNIGTPGGQSVLARLFCNGIGHDSDLVPLDANGDFRIDSGFVGANGNPPSPCVNARLLIVSGNGSWFAAGIPKR